MATVAAVQMTSGPEPAANLQVAARLIAEAAGQGAELVLQCAVQATGQQLLVWSRQPAYPPPWGHLPHPLLVHCHRRGLP